MSSTITSLSTRKLAVAIIVVAAVAAAAFGAVAASTDDKPNDVVVFEAEEGGKTTYLPLGEPADDPIGDQILEHKPLVDPATGKDVGVAVTRVQIMDVVDGAPLITIDCTIELTDGDIVFYGAAPFADLATPAGAVFAVTGGTGRYTGTSGTVSIRSSELDGKPGFTIDFDLTKR